MGLIDSFPDVYLPRNANHGWFIAMNALQQHNFNGHLFAFHTYNLAPASGTTVYIQINTPAAHGCAVFMTLDILAGNYETHYQEGVSISTAGSAIQIDCLNRRASVATTVVAYTGSTISTAGSVFGTRVALCTATRQAKNQTSTLLADRLLKPNTTYVFGIKPLDADTQWSLDCILVDPMGA